MNEYLRQFKEDVPQWLIDYQPGSAVPLNDLLESRIVYYPGSWFDGQPLKTVNSSHSAHVYIYVDSSYSEHEITRDLRGRSTHIRGYVEIGSWEYSEDEIWPNRQNVLIPLNYTRRPSANNFPIGLDKGRPFAKAVVFQRLQNFTDEHGCNRFVILFVKGDGIRTYQTLFTDCGQRRRMVYPWCLVLQDHGFGGNYDKFGAGGLMEAIADEAKSWPRFAIVADNTDPWEALSRPVPCVKCECGGCAPHNRTLFERIHNNREDRHVYNKSRITD